VQPTFVAFSVLLLSETLFAVALLASLIAMVRLVRADSGPGGQGARAPGKDDAIPGHLAPWRPGPPSLGWALASGFLIGAATLVRPTWLLIGPGFVVVFILVSRERLRAAGLSAVLLAGLALSLTPWTIRNALVTGHFIPTTLWVGASLYDGLNPQATGASDMRFIEDDGVYQRMSEYDADQFYRRKAKEFARQHPGRAIQLAAIKLWRFWNPIPNAEQFGRWEIAVVVGLGALPLLVLAAWGGIMVRRDPWSWLIPVAPVIYFSLVHMVFVGSIRYRLPVEYPLAVLAAVAICQLIDGYRVARPDRRQEGRAWRASLDDPLKSIGSEALECIAPRRSPRPSFLSSVRACHTF
jgi:hypothetical protein